MPTVRGTNRIKGILDIGAKQQVRKDQLIYLSDDEFYNHKVQTALQMNLIICEELAQHESHDKKVRIKNIYHNSISIGDSIRDLKPGQITILNSDDIRSAHIQAAINKGMLKIEGMLQPDGDELTEKTVKVGNLFAEKEDKVTKQTMKPIVRELETNEEITSIPRVVEMPTEVIDTPNPAPVKSVIKDPHKKSVTWNPTNVPTMKKIPETVMTGKSPTIKNDEFDMEFMEKVASGIMQQDGKPISEVGIDEKQSDPIDDDITFVDKKQEEERIANHPKLKSTPAMQNHEIDFVG